MALDTPRKTPYDEVTDLKAPEVREIYISSSEEDTSPVDSLEGHPAPWQGDFDESLFGDDDLDAISSSEDSDVAYTVSIFSVGKPRVVDVSPRGSITCQRSGSLQSRSASSLSSAPSISRGDSGDWTRASHRSTTEALRSNDDARIDEEFTMDAERFYTVFGSDSSLHLERARLASLPEPQLASRISTEAMQAVQRRPSHFTDARIPSRMSSLSAESSSSRLKHQNRLSSIWLKG